MSPPALCPRDLMKLNLELLYADYILEVQYS